MGFRAYNTSLPQLMSTSIGVVGPVTAHQATPEEMAHYGIRPPLRADLIDCLEKGMGVKEIAMLYGIPVFEAASKIGTAGYGGMRKQLSPAAQEHLDKIWPTVKAIVGSTAVPCPPDKKPAPEPEPEPYHEELEEEEDDGEESDEMPRRDEQLRKVLTPEKLAKELQESTVEQVAKNHGKSVGAINTLLHEYGMSARGVRKAPVAPATKEAKNTDAVAPAAEAEKPEPSLATEKVSVTMHQLGESMEKAATATNHFALAAGFRIHIDRAGESATVLQRDLRAMLGALEATGGRFNLTVTLEEAAG